ncbi:PLD nuclease N-terminal domain-containing protein [Ureibacillus composti]|nr:PLD nuclease N-terminal domain-containing protein [Ureibacillus composti]
MKVIEWSLVLPVVLPFVFVALLLIVIALIDLVRNRHTRENVILWAIVILFCNTIGPVLYFTVGRKVGTKREV